MHRTIRIALIVVILSVLAVLDCCAAQGSSVSGLPDVKVNIPVEHRISGDRYDGKDTFAFVLEAQDPSYPMPAGSMDGSKTITVKGEEQIDFGELVFTYPGAYDYRIYRISGDNKDFEYDDAEYRVVIASFADGTSRLVAYKAREEGKTDQIVFEDKYKKPALMPFSPKTGDDAGGVIVWGIIGITGSIALILLLKKRSGEKRRQRIAGIMAFCLISTCMTAGSFAAELPADPESDQILTNEVIVENQENTKEAENQDDQTGIDQNAEDVISEETKTPPEDHKESTDEKEIEEVMIPDNPEEEDDEGTEGSLYYEPDILPQRLTKSLRAASSNTAKIVSSYEDGKGRRFKIEGMDGYGLCSWDCKLPAPDGTVGTYEELMPDSKEKKNVIKAMYYGMYKNKASTPTNKMRLHRVICVWLHGIDSLRTAAKNGLPKAREYWDNNYASLPDPPASLGFHVYEWTPSGSYSSKQTVVTYKIIPPLRNPSYQSTKSPDRKSIRQGSTESITYTIKTEEIYTDAAAGSYQIRDDLANGLLHLDTGSINVKVTGGSFTIDKQDDAGLWVTFHSNESKGSKPSITITYRATVKWSNYRGGVIRNTLRDYTPPPVYVTNDVAVSKAVKGDMRDTTKVFEITADLKGLDKDTVYSIETKGGGAVLRAANGTLTGGGFKPDRSGNASIVFGLKGGQGAVIKNIPVWCRYRFTEAASDHVASYLITSDKSTAEIVKSKGENLKNNQTLSTAEETLDSIDGLVTVSFTNTRNLAPPSGADVNTDWIRTGLVMLASLAGIAAALIVLSRRKNNDYYS